MPKVIPLHACLAFALLLTASAGLTAPPRPSATEPSRFVRAVQTFADNVLEHGRDRYGTTRSPLFVDGINVDTREPLYWHYRGHSWVVSNFANQQNLMRVFIALSKITGEPRYRKAAEDAARYMFDHYADSQGLLRWGGHQFVDLITLEPQANITWHELKMHYPYYEFLWEVNPEATRRFLRAMWNAHVLDWRTLEFNRHGEYNQPMGSLWNSEFAPAPPFFEGGGLTFFNAGMDLILASVTLHDLGDEPGALKWGLRLYEQYVRARHPKTGLGVTQFTQPRRKTAEPPPAEGPLTGGLRNERYGDRAKNQFGHIYGAVALEGNALWGGSFRSVYGESTALLLSLAENQLKGTREGEVMLGWILDGIKAVARHAYAPEENHFRPLWADGTDLTGKVIPRTGYFGEKGRPFLPLSLNGRERSGADRGLSLLLTFARAARISKGDPEIWNVVRHMFRGRELGDPGSHPDAAPALNRRTEEYSTDVLAAVLELHRLTGRADYLALAERIGDNLLRERFHRGYFQPSVDHLYARFNDKEPVALLLLEAALRGTPELMPTYDPGNSRFDSYYQYQDINTHMTADRLFDVRRPGVRSSADR